MKNHFFQKIGYQKKKGFDSYSKNAGDIISFYYLKHPELSPEYKKPTPLTRTEIDTILTGHSPGLNTPFEKYIVAFLFAMADRHDEAEKYFLSCIESLDNSLSSAVNTTFIKLQLAQLYERKGDIPRALSTLRKVYFRFNGDAELMGTINNFYASCCVSIGLIYFRAYKNNNIAGNLFARSIHVRLKYRSNYPPLVCENYLATAYRYLAVAYGDKKIDRYVNFKTAYDLRAWLIGKTRDEFTKLEFLNLSVDLIHFLISENYNAKYINKFTNRLFKTIFSLNHDSKKESKNTLVQVGLMVSKYYFIGNDPDKFYKWYTLIKQFKHMFQMEFDESFLNSEEIFLLLKP